jgi:hypothetical protein
MSYDLFFRSPRDLDQIKAYFAEQPHVAVTEAQARYENDATGVYFNFDLGPDQIAFNMNYYRPHVFGLEAEPVVSAFVAEHAPAIHDPQREGMGDGPYSPAGFLRGWNAGNRFGYLAIGGMQDSPRPLTLPSARVESMWRWNFAKERTAEHFEDRLDELPPCFVPTIMPFQVADHEVQTAIVWDLEMEIAIPDVDLVLSTTEGGIQAVPLRDVLGLLPVHSTWGPEEEVADGVRVGIATTLVEAMPIGVTRRLRGALRPFKPLARLRPDSVLDAELVAG